MRRVITIIAKIAGFLLALFIIFIAITIIFGLLKYGPEYVGRVLAWRESSYDVYMEGFPSSTLEASTSPFAFEENLDPDRVSSLFESILEIDDFESFMEENATQAFIVIEDDVIVYENYFNGIDRESLLTSYSVAKSFVSALIGIAIEEGYIENVDDPITKYLPELAVRDERFELVTVKHILLMASGFEFQEMRPLLFNGDGPLSSYYPDQRKAALEFTKIEDPPGEYFLYNKYHPQLLGLILERSSGMSVTDFIQRYLWDPIGMEFDGSLSMDSEESGFEKMETGVNARAIDYAKLGRLYLHGGQWEGTQVVPAQWVEESISVDPSTYSAAYYPDDFGKLIFDELGGYYKYMWYGYFRGEGGFDFAAEGDRGQFIYVSPHKNLIIIRNGTAYGIHFTEWIKALYSFASEY